MSTHTPVSADGTVAHPGDLVIDTFGTFLGKRSERLVVRWRGVEDREAGRGGDAETETDGPAVVRFPGVGERESRGSKIEGRGDEAEGDPRSSTLDPRPAETDEPGEAAARGLLELWRGRAADERAKGRRGEEETVPVSRLERLDRQLRELAESGERGAENAERDDEPRAMPVGRNRGGWQEREVPFARLRSVTVAGRGVTLSSDLVEALVARGIGLSFLSGRGVPVAHLSAPGLSATVETRRAQLAAYDTPRGLALAAAFVAGKLRNQRHTLLYFGKYLKETAPARFARVQKKAAIVGRVRRQVVAVGSRQEAVGRQQEASDSPLSTLHSSVPPTDCGPRWREQLMGLEGTGARVYWEGVAAIVEGKVAFPGRETRGALDPVNAALNYGYGILYAQAFGAVVNAGLEPFAGFLHVDRPGKPSLVLDLVEEFRAPVVDRPILALINQGVKLETDAHGLTAATRRLVADRVLERLEKPVPFEGKRHRLRMVVQMQARHVATAVRGERSYRPFCSRW